MKSNYVSTQIKTGQTASNIIMNKWYRRREILRKMEQEQKLYESL